MNLQKYGSIYATFHGAPSFEIIQDVVVLPFTDTTKIRSIVLKIRYFDRVVQRSKTPFVSALKAFHKTDAVDTAFLTEEASSILLGNERLVYPSPAGTFRMCATPFFLRDPEVVAHVLDGVARTPRGENVYLYRNTVLYLDDADVPRPGKTYLDHDRDGGGGLFRICLVTSEPREVIEKICAEWRHRREVLTIPFRSLPTEADVSMFLRPTPTAEVRFPDCTATGTALVHKKLSVSRPGFLIQDVLNSYRTNGGSLRDLGLFVEHPLRVSHDGLSRRTGPRHFLSLLVNGNVATRVLLVRCPYERYTEYSHVPPVAWTSVLYDDQPLPQNVSRVTVDSTILGYRHGRTFLCLGHPMLAATALYPNLNGGALLDADPGFDPRADRHLEVVESYPLDGRRLLHRVKHRALDNELWCTSTPKVHSKRDYARRAKPPRLVEEWLRFAERNGTLGAVDHGDLYVVKLALILSRHRVCYSMRRGSEPNRRDVRFEGTGEIVFQMDDTAIDFINGLRLDGYKDRDAAARRSEEERCSVS